MKGAQVGDNLFSFGVGSRVDIEGEHGTLKFVGEVKGTQGLWLGIDWDNDKRGKHNGSYNGIKYFSTRLPSSGSFVRPERVSPVCTVAEAIKQRYGQNKIEVLSEKAHKIAPDKVIEFVGAEKMSRKIGDLNNLKEAVLTSMGIIGTNESDELSKLVPNLEELDLSSNLLCNWEMVATIVQQLPALKSIILSNNFLGVPDNPEPFTNSFKNIRTVVMNKMGYTWNQVIQCSAMFPKVEILALKGNQITSLAFKGKVPLNNLFRLDLSNNPLENWDEVLFLGHLSSLQELILSETNLSSVHFPNTEPDAQTTLFPALENLTLSHNKLKDWENINELNKLCRLEKLSLKGNPLLVTETWETSRQIIIAKIASLKCLDKIDILKQERKGAEVDYLKRYFVQSTLNQENDNKNSLGYSKEFIKQHPRYPKLVEVHGASEESEVVMVTKKIQFINLKIICPLLPDKLELERKFPISLTVGKLKGFVHRFYNIPISNLKLFYRFTEKDVNRMELDNELQPLSFYSLQNNSQIEALF